MFEYIVLAKDSNTVLVAILLSLLYFAKIRQHDTPIPINQEAEQEAERQNAIAENNLNVQVEMPEAIVAQPTIAENMLNVIAEMPGAIVAKGLEAQPTIAENNLNVQVEMPEAIVAQPTIAENMLNVIAEMPEIPEAIAAGIVDPGPIDPLWWLAQECLGCDTMVYM